MREQIPNLIMISVIFLMFGVGLRTSVEQLAAVTRDFRPLLRGILANFLLVPVLFYLCTNGFGLDADVAIGLLIMAAAPVAPIAAPIVGIARGDVPYAVGLMTIVALLCVPLTPVILIMTLPTSEEGLSLDVLKIIQVILTAQLIPIAVGMVTHRLSPVWTGRLVKFIPAVGSAGIMLGMALILFFGHRRFIDLGPVAHLAAVAGVLACLIIGNWMMAGAGNVARRTLSIATAIRNPALGLLVGTSNFSGSDVIPALLVFTIWSILLGFSYAKLVSIRASRASA